MNRGEVLRIIEERRGLAQQEMNENTEANGDIDFIDDDVYVESRKSPTQSKGVKQGKQTKRAKKKKIGNLKDKITPKAVVKRKRVTMVEILSSDDDFETIQVRTKFVYENDKAEKIQTRRHTFGNDIKHETPSQNKTKTHKSSEGVVSPATPACSFPSSSSSDDSLDGYEKPDQIQRRRRTSAAEMNQVNLPTSVQNTPDFIQENDLEAMISPTMQVESPIESRNNPYEEEEIRLAIENSLKNQKSTKETRNQDDSNENSIQEDNDSESESEEHEIPEENLLFDDDINVYGETESEPPRIQRPFQNQNNGFDENEIKLAMENSRRDVGQKQRNVEYESDDYDEEEFEYYNNRLNAVAQRQRAAIAEEEERDAGIGAVAQQEVNGGASSSNLAPNQNQGVSHANQDTDNEIVDFGEDGEPVASTSNESANAVEENQPNPKNHVRGKESRRKHNKKRRCRHRDRNWPELSRQEEQKRRRIRNSKKHKNRRELKEDQSDGKKERNRLNNDVMKGLIESAKTSAEGRARADERTKKNKRRQEVKREEEKQTTAKLRKMKKIGKYA